MCSEAYYNSTVSMHCNCGTILHTQEQHGVPSYAEDEVAVAASAATLLETPVVRADLKELKKKQTALTKARTAFATILRGSTVAYKAATETYFDQIKEVKNTMTTNLKATPEYKESLKCRRVYESTLNAFKTKHNMTRAVLREVIGCNAYYRYRYSNDSVRMLRRRFRIKI